MTAGGAGGLAADALRLLARLSAAVAAPARLPGAIRSVVAAGLLGEGEEVLLQSHLFAGYPAALEALRAWREVVPEPAADGEARAGGAPPAAADVRARGEAVCRAVYGAQYAPLREAVARLHPALERWMLEDGYGKVLGRPGLALPVRELCVVALAAGLDAPRQLYSHLRGALNAGATEDEVEDALGEAAAVHGPERARAAAAVWARVRGREAGMRRENGNAGEDG